MPKVIQLTRSNVFNLDNTAPTCSISGNPTSWTTSATLTATGTDTGGSGLSSVVFIGTTSASKTVTSNESVSATVTDKAGNTNTCSVNVTKIDTDAPTCTITGNPTSWTKNATLTVSGTDSQSGVSGYSWDGTNYSTTQTKSITANGTYTAYVKDNVGRIKNCSASVTKIDATAPTVTFGTNGNSTYAKSQSTKVTVTDSQSGVATLKYQWTTSTTAPTASTFTTSFTSGTTFTNGVGTGSYYLWILAFDNAGNQIITRSNVFNLENTINAPALSSSSGTTNSITAVYSAGSAVSGIKSTTCYYGTTSNPTNTGTLSGNNCVFSNLTSNTTYYYKKCITSNAGNTACSKVSSLLTAGGVYAYDYTGKEQTLTIPVNGTYKLETWGAQGGNGWYVYDYTNAEGGVGGYSFGMYFAKIDTKLYINVGEQGQKSKMLSSSTEVSPTSYKSYNGGGQNNSVYVNPYFYANGGGGGATHIANKSGLLSTLENSKSSILIVAGGGGGANLSWDKNVNGNAGYREYNGGSGGGYKGNSGTSWSASYEYGLGGQQQSISSGTYRGKFGQGADGGTTGAGGGGGFYGGNGSKTWGSAGGGSGYIGNTSLTDKGMYCYNCESSTAIDTKTTSTTCTSSTPTANCAKQGNGYAKITILSTSN